MINTRRAHPFRYTMLRPVICQLKIVSINNIAISSKLAEVELIDINKGGCKIRTLLDLQVESHEISTIIHICLHEQNYVIPGTIRWQRQLEAPYYYYGIKFDLSNEYGDELNRELRYLAASNQIVVQ